MDTAILDAWTFAVYALLGFYAGCGLMFCIQFIWNLFTTRG